MLDSDIQSLIGTTKFKYMQDDTNDVITLERSVFALSGTELGKTADRLLPMGSTLPIASTLSVAYQNNGAVSQWTRSSMYTGFAGWYVDKYGGIEYSDVRDSHGYRPVFTLPSSLQVDENLNVMPGSVSS